MLLICITMSGTTFWYWYFYVCTSPLMSANPAKQNPPLGTSRLAWSWDWCASLLRSWALSFWREVSLCLRADSRLQIRSTCCSARVVWHTQTHVQVKTQIAASHLKCNERLPSYRGLSGHCFSPSESSRKPGWLPPTSPLSPYSSGAETKRKKPLIFAAWIILVYLNSGFMFVCVHSSNC